MHDSPTLTQFGGNVEFKLRDKHLKKYPHFDQLISTSELVDIITDPERVATNAFLPLLQYVKSYQPFRDPGNRPKKKERLIRYASRRDSTVFSYYRHQLAEKYEERLVALGIHDIPIAYRKIPLGDGSESGKCNIDFANDLFMSIRECQSCSVVALDIRKYFESIDHRRLYQIWCELIGVEKLPPDHLAVFKAITRYRFVDRSAAYARLGYIGEKLQPNGTKALGYLVPHKKMPKQLCSPEDFRAKIAGNDPQYDSLIQENSNDHGIPQGAPISDLLANAYLLAFDVGLATYVRARGGRYWRYSDDLVLVLPGDGDVGPEAASYVESLISNFGDALKIKASKTSIGRFVLRDDGTHEYQHVAGDGGADGIQYLGFRFDGRCAYIRNSTLSNFYRKITRRARRQAAKHVARFDGKDRAWLLDHFDFHSFEERFGRVRDFESVASPRGWTFWTYAKRASERFGPMGDPILRQVSRYRRYVRRAVADEIDRQLVLRSRDGSLDQ